MIQQIYPYDASDPFGKAWPVGEVIRTLVAIGNVIMVTRFELLLQEQSLLLAGMTVMVIMLPRLDGYNLYWSYIHLSQIAVSEGQYVNEGDVIGASGNRF